MSDRELELERSVEQAMAALDADGGQRCHDAWLDPAALGGALEGLVESEGSLWLRAARALGSAQDGYAAEPRDGAWLRLTSGSAQAAYLPLRSGSVTTAEVVAVRCQRQPEPCCSSSKCTRNKQLVTLALQLDDGEELIVGEQLAAGDDGVALDGVAERLAGLLHVELEGEVKSFDAEPPGDAVELSAVDLGRWALRREGPRFVLRDHASVGPRQDAKREYLMVAALALGALGGWYLVAQAYTEQAWERLAIFVAISAVLTLAAWAMSTIAAHSAKYSADSTALLSLYGDRLVIAPWLSRHGAVDLGPAGRYGAAMPLAEVQELTLTRTDAGWTIGCSSEHGPFFIGTLASEQAARAWLAALERWLADAAHARRESAPARRAPKGAALATAVLTTLGLAIGVAGCSADGVGPAQPPASSGAPSAMGQRGESPGQGTSSAVGTVATPAPTPTAAALQLIDDDIPAARAKAKADGKALFVEVWAPWCHTCLSMKNFVLPDAAIVALQDRVVFSAVDSDRPDNAEFMERYAVNVWPTLYVLEPSDGSVLGMWPGAASIEELRTFVERAIDDREAMKEPGGAAAAFVSGKRAEAARKHAQAARFFQQALERGGNGWERRSAALHGLVNAEWRQRHFLRCAQLGVEHTASIVGAAVPTDFAYIVLECADELRGAKLADQARKVVRARLVEHTRTPPPSASVDDKADALSLLARLLRRMGDPGAARAAIEKQIALLDDAAKRAPSPEAAATFDYQRLNAYLALGRGEDAVRMLQERSRQLPDAYEPRARLASALSALKRYKEAAVAIEDAIGKSYGPRKLGYLRMSADIHAALGDVAGRRAALEALLKAFDELDGSSKDKQRNKELAARAKAELAKLGGG